MRPCWVKSMVISVVDRNFHIDLYRLYRSFKATLISDQICLSVRHIVRRGVDDMRSTGAWWVAAQNVNTFFRETCPHACLFVTVSVWNSGAKCIYIYIYIYISVCMCVYRYFKVELTLEWRCQPCVRSSIHFWNTNGCSCESVKVFEKLSRPEGDSNLQPSCGYINVFACICICVCACVCVSVRACVTWFYCPWY